MSTTMQSTLDRISRGEQIRLIHVDTGMELVATYQPVAVNWLVTEQHPNGDVDGKPWLLQDHQLAEEIEARTAAGWRPQY